MFHFDSLFFVVVGLQVFEDLVQLIVLVVLLGVVFKMHDLILICGVVTELTVVMLQQMNQLRVVVRRLPVLIEIRDKESKFLDGVSFGNPW